MASPRLPFLWPMLFKPSTKPPRIRAHNPARRPRAIRCLTTTPRHFQAAPNSQRYGTAQEPAPHLREKKVQKEDEPADKLTPDKGTQDPAEEEEEEDTTAAPPPPTSQPSSSPTQTSAIAADEPPKSPAPGPPKTPEQNPLDTVLHMPSPQEEEQRKAPHLKPPPYVHHFDTYSLVKDLSNSGGFTNEQAITVMKAVRSILTDNMALAREGLVSKSNVENETYLFRAACSELHTEVGNSRKGEIERMRTERNQLQHEVDILNQRMSQELAHLKDELKGLFDDRKMAVRQEQRVMETKIQELNYMITVVLNSDARSEVEALRWILTRRAAITVGVSAFILFIALKFSSNVAHQQQSEEKKKKERQEKTSSSSDGEHNGHNGNSNANNLGKDQSLGGELLATEGGVSLG